MDVLVVEASTEHSRGTAALLESESYITVERVSTGEDAIEIIIRRAYDVVVLAWSLPDMLGNAVLHAIREAGVTVPVIVLSSFAPSLIVPKACEAGATAVMSLPVNRTSLASLLRDIARQAPARANDTMIRVGSMEVYLALEEVWVDGTLVPLTRKEYQTVELMARRRGVVLTKNAFYAQLYSGIDKPDISIIDIFVAKARRKLMNAGAGNPIATVWRRGYMIANEDEQTVVADLEILSPENLQTPTTAGSHGVDETEHFEPQACLHA